jgi:glyoxylase-like metal-dependent hydrolase (beta-lactamase superfamily II)
MSRNAARSIRVGPYEAAWVRDSGFALDGGTMFHTVPRVLWARKAAPDERNRIRFGLNSLLIRGGGRTILVDAGVGNKLPPRQQAEYGIDPAENLPDSLRAAGVSPADVDTVILTHLHLDHAGWLTVRVGDRLEPLFPRARHVIQKAEWAAAHETNELTDGSYMPDDFDPVFERGLVDLVDGIAEVAPGVTVERTGAHCAGHQAVTVRSGDTVLVCPCELVPTRWHLRMAWIMSYDLEPLRILEWKRRVLSEAAEQGHVLFLSHDPECAFGRVRRASAKEYVWETT